MLTEPRFLVPTVIEPKSLTDYREPRDWATHRGLIDVLRMHGVVRMGDGDDENLEDAFLQLSDRAGKAWAELLVRLKNQNRVEDTPKGESTEAILNRLANSTKSRAPHAVAVASEQRLSADEADSYETPLVRDEWELVTPPFIGDSTLMKQAMEIQGFPGGTPREKIARVLLRPLAQRSKEIRVFDPYLFRHIIENDDADHTQWLIRELVSSMRDGSTLRLYSDLKEAPSSDKVRGRVSAALKGALSDLKEEVNVEVTLVHNYVGPHPAKLERVGLENPASGGDNQTNAASTVGRQGRYIYFGPSTAFLVEHGFTALSSRNQPTKSNKKNNLNPIKFLWLNENVINGLRFPGRMLEDVDATATSVEKDRIIFTAKTNPFEIKISEPEKEIPLRLNYAETSTPTRRPTPLVWGKTGKKR